MPSTQFSSSQQQTGMVPGMKDVYGQLLGLNQQNYSNILNTYAQGQGNLQGQLGGIYQGYGQLGQQVNQTLGIGGGGWGVAQPAAQAIGQTFEKTRGQNLQSLISSGLGNTTLQQNMANQNAAFASQAYGGLGAQLAQTAAGYQAQLGQAGLQSRMAGLGMQTNLANSLMGHLAGYHFANTAGSLTGGFGSSQGKGQSVGEGGGGFAPNPFGHIPWAAGMGGGGGYTPNQFGSYALTPATPNAYLGGGAGGGSPYGMPDFSGGGAYAGGDFGGGTTADWSGQGSDFIEGGDFSGYA